MVTGIVRDLEVRGGTDPAGGERVSPVPSSASDPASPWRRIMERTIGAVAG
jgi:hypothetical protein